MTWLDLILVVSMHKSKTLPRMTLHHIGVGFTTPGVFAFLSTPESVPFSEVLNGAMNETFISLGTMYAKAQNMGTLVKTRVQSVSELVSTPIVATDMLSIVKAFGMDKLQYWGFS